MLTGRKSPQSLRDRLFSNSPDPLKSSILRESGMGWASTPPESQDSPNNGSITSPLRIAKRESPRTSGPQLARRTSSSYKHVRNNNLVTKSPFKSQIPAPSTPSRPSSVAFPLARRVSGEKRPRPVSIYEQTETENERPFALKRERRQSKGFQGLLEKEPVSKSPFRLQQSPASSQTPPPMPSTSQSPDPGFIPRDHTPSPNTGPSPARSSLVSRRLHGPRLSGIGRRERRKTVTFDERCDVMEFAPDEDEEGDFMSGEGEMSGDGSDQQDDDDPFFRGDDSSRSADAPFEDASYDSTHLSDIDAETPISTLLHLDPDASITGLVDEMFASNSAVGEPLRYSTPPRTIDIPPDLETENGVPLGRSHHVERNLQHHQHPYHSPHPVPPFFSQSRSLNQSQSRSSPSVSNSPDNYPFNISVSPRASPLGRPITPRETPISGPNTPPPSRTTHVEHPQIAKEDDTMGDIDVDNDLARQPLSPSPMKPPTFSMRESDTDILIQSYGSPSARDAISGSPLGSNPSAHENIDNSTNEDDCKDDSLNLSIGNSEISLTGLGRDPEALIDKTYLEGGSIVGEQQFRGSSPRPVMVEGSRSSPLMRERSHSPASIPSHMSSPLFRSGSPLLMNRNRNGSNTSLTGRQRITREDVHRRLLTRRSIGSPAPDVEPESKSSDVASGSCSTPQITEGVTMLGDTKAPDQGFGTAANSQDRNAFFSTESIDVEMADGCKTRDSATSLSRNAGDGDFSQDVTRASRTDKEAFLGEAVGSGSDGPDSLGVLARTPGDDVKMDSVSSGSSGNSSATAVDATAVDTTAVDAAIHPSIKLEFNDVDMDMKSALDRLMDDVAGVGSREGEDSIMTERESFEVASTSNVTRSNRAPLARAKTEPAPLLHTSTGIGFSPDKDKSDPSIEVTPPPLPPKGKTRNQEQMETDSAEELENSEEFYPQRRAKSKRAQQRLLGIGRPSRRRSMSTGDADDLRKQNGGGLLDGVVSEVAGNDALADSIEKELKKLVEPQKKAGYQVREREATIYASSSDPDGVTHMSGPGDVNTGKAWRAVRRPSDMNEYSKQIKEYRAQEKSGKAYGKVFVKILGIKNMLLPLPNQPTSLMCTLNNGIHFVTTPECQLGQNTRIDQEFELIEHSKLEFTLTLKIKRDPHIMAQFKSLVPAPAPPAPPPVVQVPSKSGMRSFFSSTPKRTARDKPPVPSPPTPVRRLPENLARYMKPDGTLARSFVAFKDIAHRCDARLFETSYPLIGQRLEIGGKFSTQQVGELVLQIFRLPPLPGMPPDQLPQSLDECCRGLRHINWHKVTYFEGTLTQNGGDCSMWRRRRFRVIGANLVAFNDITKKATATIDLKQAISVEDDQQGRCTSMSPASSRTSRYGDEYDALFGVERSFRVIFPNDEEIAFFADTDEEKAKWLDIFRALVGHIPPHPLWGELLWQRQEELKKRT